MTDIIGDLSEKLVDANGNVDTTTANLLVGKTAISGFTALLQAGGDRLGSFTDALETSNGTADRMASTMQNNVKGALEELGGAFESIGLKIYDKIDTPLKDAINGFTNFIEKVGDLGISGKALSGCRRDHISSFPVRTDNISNLFKLLSTCK